MEEDDEGEEKEERAIEGKSRATCTRQQPPTSEELIINLLSPSPNAAVPIRPPSLHFHLRLSLSSATLSHLIPSARPLHSHSSFLPCYLSLSSRSHPPTPLLSASPLISLFSYPLLSSTHVAPWCVYDYDYSHSRFSPLSLRGLAFDFRPRPIDLQTLSLLSVYLTHAGCDAQRHDA